MDATKGPTRSDTNASAGRGLLCVALLAFCIGAQSQQPASRRTETGKAQQSTQNPKRDSKNDAKAAKPDLRGTRQSPFVVEALPSEHTHTKTDEEKNREKDKAREDRIIAHSTFALAIVSGLLAVLTLGLMIFTGKLWKATNKLVVAADFTARHQALDMRESLDVAQQALKAAEKSADVAEKTVKTMRDTATRQLRPYVSITLQYKPYDLVPDEKYGPFAKVIPIWSNSGETPTIGMKAFAEAAHMNRTLAATGPILLEVALDQGMTIFRRSTAEGTPILLQESQLLTHETWIDPLFIYGVAEYRDAFGGGQWRTEFCFEVVVMVAAITKEIALTFRPYGRYNRADEDCIDWHLENPTWLPDSSPKT